MVENKNKNVSRYKKPYFCVGLGGVILTTLQVEATSLTLWASVGQFQTLIY